MRDWYGMEMRFRRWMDKPMSTMTTVLTGSVMVFLFGLMIYLSM